MIEQANLFGADTGPVRVKGAPGVMKRERMKKDLGRVCLLLEKYHIKMSDLQAEIGKAGVDSAYLDWMKQERKGVAAKRLGGKKKV